jgi:hypothetical protein
MQHFDLGVKRGSSSYQAIKRQLKMVSRHYTFLRAFPSCYGHRYMLIYCFISFMSRVIILDDDKYFIQDVCG